MNFCLSLELYINNNNQKWSFAKKKKKYINNEDYCKNIYFENYPYKLVWYFCLLLQIIATKIIINSFKCVYEENIVSIL